MKHIRLILTLLLTLPILSLSSCHHKELCYLHPHGVKVQVVYDWTDAPDANPLGMCAFFYNLDDDTQSVRFDFIGTQGGEVELIPGNYRVLTYNNDTEIVRAGNTNNFDGHYFYTREGNILEPIYGNGLPLPPRSDASADERVMITPDLLWGCSEVDIVVTGTENQIITLYPHDLLCHYSYEVRNVKNLKHVSMMSGALSGMAPALTLSTEQLHSEPVTLPFEAWRDGASTIRGEFYTFGHHPEGPKPHKMSFYMVMDDGSKYSFTTGRNLDVTDQVHSAPNPKRVHLIIDGLELPTPIENGNGFKPEVDDWGDVLQDIEL